MELIHVKGGKLRKDRDGPVSGWPILLEDLATDEAAIAVRIIDSPNNPCSSFIGSSRLNGIKSEIRNRDAFATFVHTLCSRVSLIPLVLFFVCLESAQTRVPSRDLRHAAPSYLLVAKGSNDGMT